MKAIRLFFVLVSCFILTNCVYHRDYGYRGHDRGRYERHDRRDWRHDHHRDYARDHDHDRFHDRRGR